MAKEAVVSNTPTSPYACKISCQSTSLSFPGIRGFRSSTSASGVSYASAIAATASVKRLGLVGWDGSVKISNGLTK